MMKAMYIERHNAATRKILRLILEGSRGSCLMLADVSSTDKLGNIGLLDSRLPEWLVPTNILQQRGLDRDKLRPDILMTSSRPANALGAQLQQSFTNKYTRCRHPPHGQTYMDSGSRLLCCHQISR